MLIEKKRFVPLVLAPLRPSITRSYFFLFGKYFSLGSFTLSFGNTR